MTPHGSPLNTKPTVVHASDSGVTRRTPGPVGVATEPSPPFGAANEGTSTGTPASALTNEQCSPYTIHWAYDTVALAKGTGNAVVKAGGKTWYFLQADYAFGAALQNDTSTVVKAAGGTVVGTVKHPLSASDFSSFLLQAQGSKAQILGMANAGGDTINTIKAANEFGITKTMKLAGLLVFINDIHSLGLKTTQGMYLTDSWYWNKDAEARAWSRKFFEKIKRMPSSIQAADYSATLQYLKAVKAVGTDDTDKVIAGSREGLTTASPFTGPAPRTFPHPRRPQNGGGAGASRF